MDKIIWNGLKRLPLHAFRCSKKECNLLTTPKAKLFQVLNFFTNWFPTLASWGYLVTKRVNKCDRFIRQWMILVFKTPKYSSFNPPYFQESTLKFVFNSIRTCCVTAVPVKMLPDYCPPAEDAPCGQSAILVRMCLGKNEKVSFSCSQQ